MINEACEMIDTFTKPKDSLDRVGITVYDSILTLPRNYSTCLGILRGTEPLQIRGPWVEFILSGPGSILGESDPDLCGEIIDMGDGYSCIREPSDVNADGCRIKVYTDGSASSEVYESIIEFYGLDGDGDIIRTTTGSTIRSGEALNLLASSGNATTTNSFTRLTQVVKPNTNGIITVYAIDPDDSSENLIATYQPSEKRPNYRRYKVPPAPDGTSTYTATCLCRRRFVTAELDNDILCVDHFGALLYGCLYISYRDVNDDERAERSLKMALDILSKQAVKFRPASTYPPPIINMDELEHRTTQGY